jgi:hypothetical protein
VGKSILESYSRVLESLASNIIARIDDLLNVDEMCKQSSADHRPIGGADANKITSCGKSNNCIKAAMVPYQVLPASGTPYETAYTTPSCFSPPQPSSPQSRIGRAVLVDRRTHHGRLLTTGAKRTMSTDDDDVEVVKGMVVSCSVFELPTDAIAEL